MVQRVAKIASLPKTRCGFAEGCCRRKLPGEKLLGVDRATRLARKARIFFDHESEATFGGDVEGGILDEVVARSDARRDEIVDLLEFVAKEMRVGEGICQRGYRVLVARAERGAIDGQLAGIVSTQIERVVLRLIARADALCKIESEIDVFRVAVPACQRETGAEIAAPGLPISCRAHRNRADKQGTLVHQLPPTGSGVFNVRARWNRVRRACSVSQRCSRSRFSSIATSEWRQRRSSNSKVSPLPFAMMPPPARRSP